jgi:exodeoxyribonuclease V alpha subunit
MTAQAIAIEDGRDDFTTTVVRPLHQTDHGFRIVRTQRDDGREVVILGDISSANVGERLRVQGLWEKSAKYGPRFRVETAAIEQPTTEDGLVECLSKMIDGVGPGLARKYVALFGGVDGMLAFLAGNRGLPEPLGLPPPPFVPTASQVTHLVELRDRWQVRAKQNEIELGLASLGLTPALRAKVRAAYGPDAVTICRSRPYDLAFEVDGFGFKRADELARAAGVAVDSDGRREAALLHVLTEDSLHGGHVFCTRSWACSAVERLCTLPIDDEEFTRAAGALVARGCAIVSESGSIGLRSLLEAEREIAALLQGAVREVPLDASSYATPQDAVRVAELDSGLELMPEQRAALAMLYQQKTAIITGGPGVGKSTVTKAVCALWEGAGVSFKLAAPTGRAARRLAEATGREATTIHRMLGYDPKKAGFIHDRGNPLEVDALLLDESSMIDVELLRSVLLALPKDCRVVFVGDADQLPPVGPGAPFRDLCVSQAIPTTRLETVHRQAAGSRIVGASREVLQGKAPTPSAEGDRADGALFVVEEKGVDACRDLVVALLCGGLTASFPWCSAPDVQIVSPQRKGPLGVAALNDAIQARINPRPLEECYEAKHGKDRVIQFRVGDRVMQTKNDYNRGVVNGELGVVVEMFAHSESNKEAPVLSVRYVDGADEKIVEYARGDLHHLDLAYCTTVHKVQGAEFPAVLVICHESHRHMLERSLLYTALTRAKKLCVLLGTRRAINGAAKNARSDDRRTTLHALMRPRS